MITITGPPNQMSDFRVKVSAAVVETKIVSMSTNEGRLKNENIQDFSKNENKTQISVTYKAWENRKNSVEVYQ